MARVTQLDTDSLVFGGLRDSTAYNFNEAYLTSQAYMSPQDSSLDNLAQHPGFTIQPLAWCSTAPTVTPQTSLFFSIATSAELAGSLLQLSTTLGADPVAVTAAVGIFPGVIILQQNVTAADVVSLASHGNGSVSIRAPLLLYGPAFPIARGALPPSPVTLDLAGCIGCMSLYNSAAHVYLTDLGLTGLERPTSHNSSSSSSSSSQSGGAQLFLPLWAFQFDRSSGNFSVHLRNVTLTLPHEEFLLLLMSLPAGEGQQHQPAGGLTLPADVELTVRRVCGGKGLFCDVSDSGACVRGVWCIMWFECCTWSELLPLSLSSPCLPLRPWRQPAASPLPHHDPCYCPPCPLLLLTLLLTGAAGQPPAHHAGHHVRLWGERQPCDASARPATDSVSDTSPGPPLTQQPRPVLWGCGWHCGGQHCWGSHAGGGCSATAEEDEEVRSVGRAGLG